MSEQEISQDENSPAASGASTASQQTSDQQFQVDFIAGKLRIPVSKLTEWLPGHVVRNQGVFYPKVQAVCNGKVIAEGELVEVGEQIGFRVTNLNRA